MNWLFVWHTIYGCCSPIGQFRGHSRNRPKGGRNSLQSYISTRFAYYSSQFYSQRIQKHLQWPLSAVFCTKLHLIRRAILLWTHKTTNFLSKNYFTEGQRVVSRPPRPIARMAPVYRNRQGYLSHDSALNQITGYHAPRHTRVIPGSFQLNKKTNTTTNYKTQTASMYVLVSL